MADLGFSYQGTCIVVPIQIPVLPQVSAPLELFYAHSRCVAQSRVGCVRIRSYLPLYKTISASIKRACYDSIVERHLTLQRILALYQQTNGRQAVAW